MPQMQYGRGNLRNQNVNGFGIPPHLANGYGFATNGSIPALDPHGGSAVAAAHAAQWNQQAAIAAQQNQLYEQYNAGPNNI